MRFARVERPDRARGRDPRRLPARTSLSRSKFEPGDNDERWNDVRHTVHRKCKVDAKKRTGEVTLSAGTFQRARRVESNELRAKVPSEHLEHSFRTRQSVNDVMIDRSIDRNLARFHDPGSDSRGANRSGKKKKYEVICRTGGSARSGGDDLSSSWFFDLVAT